MLGIADVLDTAVRDEIEETVGPGFVAVADGVGVFVEVAVSDDVADGSVDAVIEDVTLEAAVGDGVLDAVRDGVALELRVGVGDADTVGVDDCDAPGEIVDVGVEAPEGVILPESVVVGVRKLDTVPVSVGDGVLLTDGVGNGVPLGDNVADCEPLAHTVGVGEAVTEVAPELEAPTESDAAADAAAELPPTTTMEPASTALVTVEGGTPALAANAAL